MADKVFINGRAAVHKGSAGKSIAFPDVCLCPPTPPAGPIPTPLPNNVMAVDLDGGAASVLIDGNPAGKQTSFFKRSTGNEPSQPTGGGVITHAVQGKAYFQTFSPNVFFEGEPAVRHMDLLTHNHLGPQPGNTPPTVWMSTMRLPPVVPKVASKRLRDGKDWVGLEIVDQHGHPHGGRRFRITLPGNRVLTGRLPSSGKTSFLGISSGEATFALLPSKKDFAKDSGSTIRVGKSDCFAKIADDLGLSDWRELYQSDVNRSLRDKRKSPFILAAGDEIAIPARTQPPYRCATGRDHRIVIPRLEVTVRLRLKDGGRALSKAKYVLEWSGTVRKGSTDTNGWLQSAVPAWVSELTIRLPDTQQGFRVRLGALNPLDVDRPAASSLGQRLAALGFLNSADESEDGVLLVDALIRFQISRKLSPTGIGDVPTVQALLDAHGEAST